MAEGVLTKGGPGEPPWCSGAEHGERLRLAIQHRGMGKLSVVACTVGVTESAVSRWRNGGAMSLGNVAIVCQRLDISADWLVLGRGHMDMHLSDGTVGFPQIAQNLAKLSPHARLELNHFLAALVNS